MTAPAVAEPTTSAPAAPKELVTTPPEGFEFVYDEVKTAKGATSLGEVPLLVAKSVDALRAVYGDEGVLDICDGTSLRVSFQGIARRMKAAGKSDDEIKDAQIRFRPGKRAGGVSTPVSRAARAAKGAAEKVDGDLIASLMEQISSGKISQEDLQSLVG